MTADRLPDYLGHMRQAIADASGFVEGMAKCELMNDKRTQQAVVMRSKAELPALRHQMESLEP